MSTHIVIPDTQVKPGVPIDHLAWAGRYIREQFGGQPDVTVVHLGDHWDMPSLSSYDKGKRCMNDRSYAEDVEAGNRALHLLTTSLQRKNWTPRLVMLRGNHEARITRAEGDASVPPGTVSLTDLESPGWEVYGYQVPVDIDGIWYSHMWYNPANGRSYSGMVETRLKQIGHSFTQGHQQGLQYALRPVGRTRHHGLVAGSFYQHEERYMGPQAVAYWRGIVVCHEVKEGTYDPMFVSLGYLKRRYASA